MPYEAAYERFSAAAPGKRVVVEFRKAGFIASGYQPELYFFSVDGTEQIVALSGEALRLFQHGRRHLSREEKMDIAGLALKKQIEAGRLVTGEHLRVALKELRALAQELGFEPPEKPPGPSVKE